MTAPPRPRAAAPARHSGRRMLGRVPLRDASPDAAARPLRVAWFGHGAGGRADGLSTYSRELVAALRSRGHDVRPFLHDVDGPVAADDAVTLRAIRLKTITWSLPGSGERVARALDEFGPDIVHCSWSFGSLDGEIGRLAHERGAGTVATFHLPYADPRSARGRVLRGLYRFHSGNLSHYDRCVALSSGQRDLLVAAGYPADRIVVVPNGVDTGAISPGPSRLRRQLGASFVIGYVGRLDPEKRVPRLVESFTRHVRDPDAALLVAGGGSQERRVRRLAGADRRVRVLGVVTDSATRLDLLRACDVVVLPSTAEGLALSLLEGMAAGCAVVATDAGDDGAALADSGVLIPVRPLEPGLGSALERLEADPALRTALGAAARARVVARYDLRRNVERVVALYRELKPGLAAAR